MFLPDFEHEIRRVRHRLPGFDDGAEIVYVPGANHTLSRMAWKTRAIEHATDWLDRKLPRIAERAAG